MNNGKNIPDWEIFEKTGNIDTYLAFKNSQYARHNINKQMPESIFTGEREEKSIGNFGDGWSYN